MGELLSYMLRSSLVLTAMYLVYKWIMSPRNQHSFNRAMLLWIYAMAMTLPAIPAVNQVMSLLANKHNATEAAGLPELPTIVFLDDNTVSAAPLVPIIIVAIYIIGMAAMTIATVASYVRLTHIVSRGNRTKMDNGTTIVTTTMKRIAPFSWMHYIVITKEDYAECGTMIVTHELEHLRQHHWIDMLVAQVVIILQWFNPVAWLMRDELRAVHEYQADAAVLQSGADARQYQLLLIKKAVGKSFPALANSLNHSKLKKRITMMLKSKSSKSSRWLALALVPAAVAAVAVFNIPAVASALGEVSNAKMPVAVTDSKVTNLTENVKGEIAEISKPKAAMAEDLAMTTNGPKENKHLEIKKSDKPDLEQLNYIFTIDGKEIKPDANGNIEYNGTIFNVKEIGNLAPSNVKAMTVNREESTITIDLMTPAERAAKVTVKMPQFPGGDKALLNYVCENVTYPEGAPADGKTYRVVVQFEISSTGKVGEAKIVRSQGELFDAEALRVVNKLPDFEPGMNEKGEKVATMYTLPISFKTMGEEAAK